MLTTTFQEDQSQALDSGPSMIVIHLAKTVPLEKVVVQISHVQGVAVRLQWTQNSKLPLEPAEALIGTIPAKSMDGHSLTTWSSTVTAIQITLVD